MTIDEQIKIFESNAEFERKNGDLQGCLNFRQLAEWLKELKRHREAWEKIEAEIGNRMQEPYDMHIGEDYYSGLCSASVIVDKYRPKDGDAE